MPEFTTVSLKEAKVQTTSGRQSRYLHEYIDYITNLPNGGQEQPRAKRSYTRRRKGEAEPTAPDQPFSTSEEVEHEAVLVEESPELGQTPV
jgi:hypothetical protein